MTKGSDVARIAGAEQTLDATQNTNNNAVDHDKNNTKNK